MIISNVTGYPGITGTLLYYVVYISTHKTDHCSYIKCATYSDILLIIQQKYFNEGVGGLNLKVNIIFKCLL